MNNQNELIARVDDAIANMAINSGLLRACRAEIEFQRKVNDSLREHLAEKQAEIERLESRIAELEKPYVPMTISEKVAIRNEWLATGRGTDELISKAEAAAVKRYNEQRGVK